MNQGNNGLSFSRRSALKKIGGVAGVAAFSGVGSASDPKVARTIELNTSGRPRLNDAQVKFYDDGAIEHRMSGHNPQGASPKAFSVQLTNGSSPDRATAQLTEGKAKGQPEETGTAIGDQGAKSGNDDDIGTLGHSGGNSDSDGSGYIKLTCEKGDRCACWPEWEVYSQQSSEWNDDDGDGCISDSENLWSWKYRMNGDACNTWTHDDNDSNIWEDGNPCSLDQVREDRFRYEDDGGTNGIVMRHQLTLHDDGSNDWEVLRYDDGGNGCLLHKVETG